MGLYIDSKRVTRAKAIFVLVAVFALVAIPTFMGIRALNAKAASTPPQFLSSPHYVHASTTDNNDTAAEIAFYPGTTRLEIIVDDGQVRTYGDSPDAQSAALPAGANKIDLRLRLAPGRHTISGVAVVDGDRMPIRGSNGEESGEAVVYALDAPTVSYVTPTTDKRAFNSSISPVRVKVDDEFNQFKDLTFSLFTGKPGDVDSHWMRDLTLTRAQCSLELKDFAICDITGASNWENLAEGTYFVKLETSTKAEDKAGDTQHPDGISSEDSNYWSLPFTIDNTAPTATINGPLSMVGGETVTVKGTIDPTALGATLYMDDNAEGSVVITNGTWSYDLTTDKVGDHKLTVVAKDAAENPSDAKAADAITTLTVNPFVPSPAIVQQVNDAASGLSAPFAVPPALTQVEVPPAIGANTNADTAVLGAKTAEDPKVDQNVIAAVAPSSEGWKLFGIAWFWWIIIGALMAGITSWTLANRRQYAVETI